MEWGKSRNGKKKKFRKCCFSKLGTGVCQWVREGWGEAAPQSGFSCCCFVCFPRFLKEKKMKRGDDWCRGTWLGYPSSGDLEYDTGCVQFIQCCFLSIKHPIFPLLPASPVLCDSSLSTLIFGKGLWVLDPSCCNLAVGIVFFFFFGLFSNFFFKSWGEHLPEKQGFLSFVTSRTLQELKKGNKNPNIWWDLPPDGSDLSPESWAGAAHPAEVGGIGAFWGFPGVPVSFPWVYFYFCCCQGSIYDGFSPPTDPCAVYFNET